MREILISIRPKWVEKILNIRRKNMTKAQRLFNKVDKASRNRDKTKTHEELLQEYKSALHEFGSYLYILALQGRLYSKYQPADYLSNVNKEYQGRISEFVNIDDILFKEMN